MSERFEKELASDVDDVVALPLLDELAASEESWKDFVEEDLQSMLEVFSILKMKRQSQHKRGKETSTIREIQKERKKEKHQVDAA